MATWIQQLRDTIEQGRATEKDRWSGVITLATIKTTPTVPIADARCVIVRRIETDGALLITSDARSEKNAQLSANPSATAVFWFAPQRKQFIVTGNVDVLSHKNSDPVRAELWRETSDATRATFAWPDPGKPFDSAAEFSRSIPADAVIPVSFEVLRFKPVTVDTLDLTSHPHRRVQWEIVGGEWVQALLNP